MLVSPLKFPSLKNMNNSTDRGKHITEETNDEVQDSKSMTGKRFLKGRGSLPEKKKSKEYEVSPNQNSQQVINSTRLDETAESNKMVLFGDDSNDEYNQSPFKSTKKQN